MDEIAGEHCSADCIIHYGGACLSPTSRLTVLYVFGQQECDANHCYTEYTSLLPNADDLVIVMYDVVYAHAIGKEFVDPQLFSQKESPPSFKSAVLIKYLQKVN